jgi:hypothetical protein
MVAVLPKEEGFKLRFTTIKEVFIGSLYRTFMPFVQKRKHGIVS